MTQTFYLETTKIKTDKNEFYAYKGFPEPKKERIDVKFRKDVKNIPTTSGYITVNIDDLSLDTRKRFPVLWIHNFVEFNQSLSNDKVSSKVENLFK